MKRAVCLILVCGLFLVATSTHAADTVKWIPAAASNAGAFGSQWTTDVWIYSPVADRAITVFLSFYPESSGSTEPVEIPVTIESFNTVQLTDVVASLFGENRPGAIRIRCEYPFDARSRTMNSGGASGVFGQAISAIDQSSGYYGALLPAAANVPGADGTRSNVGFINPCDTTITVSAFIVDPEWNQGPYGSFDVELGPNGWWQGDAFEAAGIDADTINSAAITALGSGAGQAPGESDCPGMLSYLSRIDNRSNDGAFFGQAGDFFRFKVPAGDLAKGVDAGEDGGHRV